MNKSYIFLTITLLLTINQYSISQDIDTQLDTLQQSIDLFINQSGMDPEIAQDITNQINTLNNQIQANIQEDEKDIKVAASLSSLLEASNVFTQNITLPDTQNILTDLKHAARMNTLHKLILGALSGKIKDQPYYTNAYIESLGFTINNWIINGTLQALLTNLTGTIPGTTIPLNITAPAQAWTIQAIAGIIAHYTWLLQKKLAFSYQQSQDQ